MSFSTDAGEMDARLRKKLSLGEFFGLLFAFFLVGIFIWLMQTGDSYPADLKIYLTGPSSPMFYYGYWIIPLFDLLNLLPFPVAYAIWSAINILGVLFAGRVFGGRPFLALFSYNLLSTLYYGQISGFLTGALALLWWGIAHRKWGLAGLGFLLALTKYQVGLVLGLLLIWYGLRSWREFLKLAILPAAVGLTSLVIYPGWPFDILEKISKFPYTHLGITFWNHIGAWSLLFWLPAIALPLTKPQRFLAFFSLSTFAVPYFLQFDLLTLFSFPIGWIPLLGWLGILFPVWDMIPIYLMVIAPFLCYGIAIWPGWAKLFHKKPPVLNLL